MGPSSAQCVATTETRVVCFVAYGIILPIYNGRDTVPPSLPVGMLISLRALVKSPVARPTNATQLTGSIQVHPRANGLCKEDAINWKPQQRRKRCPGAFFSPLQPQRATTCADVVPEIPGKWSSVRGGKAQDKFQHLEKKIKWTAHDLKRNTASFSNLKQECYLPLVTAGCSGCQDPEMKDDSFRI